MATQMLKNLPLGARVVFGKHQVNTETPWGIVWTVVAKDHYGSNTVTLHAYEMIDSRCFDASEPSYPHSTVQSSGNSNYPVSNIHQWLNSQAPAGQWYSAQHTYDQSPTQSYAGGNTYYAQRAGFLYNFSTQERQAIVNTTFTTYVYSSSSTVTTTAKVFIPSVTELGLTYSKDGGTSWGYYTSNTLRENYFAVQAHNNTLANNKGEIGDGSNCMTRTPHNIGSCAYLWGNGGVASSGISANTTLGIRPALNLSGTQVITGVTNSDGNYELIYNTAPSTPSSISVPGTIFADSTIVITWGKSTDAEGDTITYELQRSVNGGTFTTIKTTTSTSYTDSVPNEWKTVQYRVCAYDTSGAYSGYRASNNQGVVHIPWVAGSDSNLGVKTSGFNLDYKVCCEESNDLTVVEKIDGVVTRSYVAKPNTNQVFGVQDEVWLKLANGTHTIQIVVTDYGQSGDATSTRTHTFTKSVDSFTIENTVPLASSTQPVRIKLEITRSIPSEATFKVEVCNNGYDSTPTWEDATSSVKNLLAHVFTNKSKTADSWGVKIRVTVSRNGAVGSCYITQIGGNFE